MTTKKVKKFGRGGDIITGLGAVLVGKALYDKYKEGKGGDKDDSSGASLKKPTISEEVEKAQKGAPKPREEYVPADKEELDAKKAALSKGMQYKKPEGPAAVEKQIVPPAVIKKKKDDSAPESNSTDRADDVIGAGIRNARIGRTAPAAKKAPSAHQNFLSSKAGLSGKGITTPGDPNKKGSTFKGRSANPIQDTIDSRSKSMARTPQQKMSEGAREVQRRREEAEKSRYKKGGSVSSASKRADGIAIRGKTRA